MSVTIRGPVRDVLAFVAPFRERSRRFREASGEPKAPGHVTELAETLHPAGLELRIIAVRDDSPTTRTYRLAPPDGAARLPPFRAGQYLSVLVESGEARASRPYSISSTPDEAAAGGYYELTVKNAAGGFRAPGAFCAPLILETWKPGVTVRCSAPTGVFYYEPLRDGERLVCLAGGCGVTPFRSIVGDALARGEARVALIHGATEPAELLFSDYFKELAERHPNRFEYLPVVERDGASPAGAWTGERGYIKAALIERLVPGANDATYFISGPDAMRRFLADEMAPWGLPPRRIRLEAAPARFSPGAWPGYPSEAASRTYTLEARVGPETVSIPAAADETLLVAMERAGLRPPSLCRSGECGWCRSRLVDGRCYSPPGPGTRAADERYGFVHPCKAFPLSTMIIEVPENPVR